MKNLQNLGKALTKAEQQTINGGKSFSCADRAKNTGNDKKNNPDISFHVCLP